MSITNLKQNDPQWGSTPYASETLSSAGCGPTAVADLLGHSTPCEVANWMTNNGQASDGQGTYREGIYLCIQAYGYSASMIGNDLNSVMDCDAFNTFKSHIQSGYCGIILFGGQDTGCRTSYWANSGHYCAVAGYQDGKYLVCDPAYDARDGLHDWDADIAGNVKALYITGIPSTGLSTPILNNPSTSTPATIMLGSASLAETGDIHGSPGDQTGNEVLLREYYTHSKGWYCLRPKDKSHATLIAQAMIDACNNSHIGYSQAQRDDCFYKLQQYGSLKNIQDDTNTDCSALVRCCIYEATGQDLGAFYTGNLADTLESSGLFESRISVSSSNEVYNGDVLVTQSVGHTEIVVSGRPRDGTADSNPGGTTPGNSAIGDILSGDAVATYTGEVNGPTVGQRVSILTPQPIFAFVNIWIGNTLLATSPAKPNIIRSFEMNYLGETAVNEVVFEVFDDNWDEIERAFAYNWNDVYIQFGYYGTGLRSQRLKYTLQKYSISFETTGTILSVSAISGEVNELVQQTTIRLNTFNPTEAVKEICKSLGYIVKDENFDESKDIVADNPFNVVSDYPLTYIMQTIVPQASQMNEELFHFSLEWDDEEKGTVAYFKRRVADLAQQGTGTGRMTSSTDGLRTYIVGKGGYDTNVLDFTADIDGLFVGGSTYKWDVATGYSSTVISTTDKTESSEQQDMSQTATIEFGDQTHINPNQSTPTTDTSGYSAEQMSNKMYYRLKSNAAGYTATLTIIGDPTIKFWGDQVRPYIRVVNVTDSGHLHHTSGVYLITRIVHHISEGYMETTLSLSRAATTSTDGLDGITILNPKHPIK